MTTDLAELFTNLDITPSGEPMPAIVRTVKDALPNPFAPALKASLEHSTPYSIFVPIDAVQRAVNLINNAARKEALGVRVVVNIKRDDNGAPVKIDGKATYLPETKGENKGKVLIRFQANAARKASTPRLYSIVKDPDAKATDGRMIRHRETGNIIAKGTHDEMRKRYEALKGGNADS